jgi:HlyD family secretion protein
MHKKRLIYLGLAVAVIAGLMYAFRPAPVPVDLAKVVRGPMEVTVNEDGKTRIKERYTVSAPLVGQMQRVELHPGDPVEAGSTVIATILPSDPALLDARAQAETEARLHTAQAALHQAQATLNRSKEAYALIHLAYDRAKTLLQTQAISREAYDEAEHKERMASEELRANEFGAQMAKYELEQVQAVLARGRSDTAAHRLERFDIKSPISGLVLRVFQESAGPVVPGLKLLELGDPNDLEVEVDVLSTDAVKIRPGFRVYLERWGGVAPLQARVRLVEPSGFLKLSALGVEEQRVNVIADLIDPRDKRITLGDAFRVEARIVIWEGTDVLKVPAGALFRRDGAWRVFRYSDGKAVSTEVRLGQQNGLEAEILGGLSHGDLVILHPTDRVRDDARVSKREK